MLRKPNRTIGSTDFVTVDFNPRLRCANPKEFHRNDAYLGRKKQNVPSLRDFNEGSFFFRGLKSTVTTSSEPTALLGLRNMSQLVRNSYELPQTAKTT